MQAEGFAVQEQAGNVFLLNDSPCRRWVKDYLNELESFRKPVR